MTYSAEDAAAELEKGCAEGYDISKISKIAFDIYQSHGLDLCEYMDRKLLELMAMDEGPEFEMSEAEFLELIAEIRAM
ncbi:MAG: hypothetical protein CMN25_02500 [Salinicola sp.]|uniref:hypothetical protein n=1 Tax=uncultured Salinicola sp. TaxID=1193542 RepID=UPI000C8C0700|nr:hypothetical protein [uncultured Salinicola sp.]MAM56185.1 hypothetical protein [Salinicola sp.]|tara:strand:- start:912 stop:1145 length:234 start_codon:yes stop_codon:yes gene_type:complete